MRLSWALALGLLAGLALGVQPDVGLQMFDELRATEQAAARADQHRIPSEYRHALDELDNALPPAPAGPNELRRAQARLRKAGRELTRHQKAVSAARAALRRAKADAGLLVSSKLSTVQGGAAARAAHLRAKVRRAQAEVAYRAARASASRSSAVELEKLRSWKAAKKRVKAASKRLVQATERHAERHSSNRP